MREDMYKVIVERPRHGRSHQDDGRAWRNSLDVGGKVGIKQGYRHRKSLNENLAPLRRWLHQQIHRPWSHVYSELSAGIDRRNTVQEHIYAHIDQFVTTQTRWIDGEVCAPPYFWSARGGWTPVRESARIELFVHPLTGILLPNRMQAVNRQRQRQAARDSSEAYRLRLKEKAVAKQHMVQAEQARKEEKYRPVRKKKPSVRA